jgi:hypothetical protein
MKVCSVPEAGGGGDGVGNAVAEECRLLQQLADPRAAATCQSSLIFFFQNFSASDRVVANQT